LYQQKTRQSFKQEMLRQLGVAIQERLGNLEFKLELGDQSNAETIELFVSKAKALVSLA
jgi:hypothetical protein